MTHKTPAALVSTLHQSKAAGSSTTRLIFWVTILIPRLFNSSQKMITRVNRSPKMLQHRHKTRIRTSSTHPKRASLKPKFQSLMPQHSLVPPTMSNKLWRVRSVLEKIPKAESSRVQFLRTKNNLILKLVRRISLRKRNYQSSLHFLNILQWKGNSQARLLKGQYLEVSNLQSVLWSLCV